MSRVPHRQPGRTPADVEQQVVAPRQQLFTFGARRLIREFDLPLSHRPLERIWRNYAFDVPQQNSAATKDLNDIPRYWPQAQSLALPVVEYCTREVRSGLLFWAAPSAGGS